jgi:hypothetical protein
MINEVLSWQTLVIDLIYIHKKISIYTLVRLCDFASRESIFCPHATPFACTDMLLTSSHRD